MTVKCSVVIRAFNEEAHIGGLLAGISRQTLKEVHLYKFEECIKCSNRYSCKNNVS